MKTEIRAEIEEDVRTEIENEFFKKEKDLRAKMCVEIEKNLRAEMCVEIEKNLRVKIEQDIANVVLATWFTQLHESNKIDCVSRFSLSLSLPFVCLRA